MPIAQARIPTDRASRYLVQLCEHLHHMRDLRGQRRAGHGPEIRRVDWTDSRGVIEFPSGTCHLIAADDGLTISLAADDTAALQHLQDLRGARLETIGRRDKLAVTW